MKISSASLEDVPELVSLINSAYRGETSRKGWTTEADLLTGDQRIDIREMTRMMQTPGNHFLKNSPDGKVITGSVFLKQDERGLYLGMLSVSPLEQDQGIGKKLMAAAEEFALEKKCRAIYMQVISVREELIAWYQRRGYHPTGERKPMPADSRFGTPTRELEFLILEKKLDALP